MATIMSYGFRSMVVNTQLRRDLIALLVVFTMVFSATMDVMTRSHLDQKTRMDQFGGGGSFEERCGSITFEDIFLYDQAIFDVRVNEDWQTAQVDAKAWINWTLADKIRKDLDRFLEGIVPSGGDGWLSTDEIDAMISIAADCLEYSITRIGIRDGSPHRGGVGIDWMNTSWQDGSTNIGHYNGVPMHHSEGRDCQGFAQEGCFEIPVVPSTERDCDINVNESLGEDECRIELWLNATMEIGGVSDPNDFTIAFNSSNMSNARLEFTFPPVLDLRLDMWEECEGRFVGSDEENPQTFSQPIRGSCLGDGTAEYLLKNNEDGSLTYSLDVNSSRMDWPLGEDVFADFTTSPVPVDNPPTWTEAAPANNSWFPVPEIGQNRFASWQDISSWFYDESGVSNLDVFCSSGESQISQSIDRSLWVFVDEIVQVTCLATDLSDQSTENRTWNIGVPIVVSTDSEILQDPHPIQITFSDSWRQPTNIQISLSQGGVRNEGKEFYNGDFSIQNVEIPSTGMVPGPVQVWIMVQVENISFQRLIDLGIVKESMPPYLTISSSAWENGLWKVGGQYSDPDGEPVTFTISVGGEEVGIVDVSGNSWESGWIDLSTISPGLSTVEITGCDNSGKCTKISQEVDSSFLFEEDLGPIENDQFSDSGSSIPAPGILPTVLSILIAFNVRRR